MIFSKKDLRKKKMSGSNGIAKFAKVNREDEFQPLKSVGATMERRAVVPPITNAALTPAQFSNDMFFNFTSPNAFTGPTSTQLFQYQQTLQNGMTPLVGSRVTYIIENNDPVNPKVITLNPAFFDPSVITIPPFNTVRVSWELAAVNNPQFYRLFEFDTLTVGGSAPAAGSIPAPLGAVATDLLVYNGTAWVPSTAFPTGQLNQVELVSGDTLFLNGKIDINQNILPYVGAQDIITQVNGGIFNAPSQFGVQVFSPLQLTSSDPATPSCSNFYSSYNNVGMEWNPAVGTDVVYHYLGFNGRAAPSAPPLAPNNGSVFIVDASGHVSAVSLNVISSKKVKQDIAEVHVDSRVLEHLRFVSYRALGSKASDPLKFGVIAEDFDPAMVPGVLVPEKVARVPDLQNAKKGIEPKMIDTTFNATVDSLALSGFLLGALKNLEQRVRDLEAANEH